MDSFDRMEDLDHQIDALEANLGAAADVASVFNAELVRAKAGLTGLGQDVATLERGISSGLSAAIKGVVRDSDSLSEALETLAGSMIDAALNAAVDPVADHLGGMIAQGLGGLFAGALPFADGASFAQGRVQPFASGGVVSGPVAFPMRGGAGLMGEAGPEAIMPLARGADGKLGVRAAQGGSVNVVMNVTTPDADSFRRSQSQIAAQLGRAIGRGQRNR